MSRTEETKRLCVELHKTQFTVSALTEDGELVLQEMKIVDCNATTKEQECRDMQISIDFQLKRRL